jgi:hypothetical protein
MTAQTSHHKPMVRAGMLTMAFRMLAAIVGPIIVAATFSAPARADAADDAFLAALRVAGIGYDSAAVGVALGRSVCPTLVREGKTFAWVTSKVADNGIPPAMAATFAGLAVKAYCPAMMNSVADGTFPAWLRVPHP